ncbi:hypothetical protein ACIQBJ_16830 [Kitasatospora sp. NPDC088391]|uniref:hypothetical protein n=1 Tax=Kitasatospora sp. NPDC088391 TaxID=3364074 RepID=UPI00381E701B
MTSLRPGTALRQGLRQPLRQVLGRVLRRALRGPLPPLVLLAGLLAVMVLAPGRPRPLHAALSLLLVLGGTGGLVLLVPLAALLGVRTVAALSGTRPRGPGPGALTGVALGVLAVLLGASVPGHDQGLLGLGLVTLLGLPVAWVGRREWQRWAAAGGDRHGPGRFRRWRQWRYLERRQREQARFWQPPADGPAPAPRRTGRWRWAAAPALVLTGAALLVLGVPGEARFAWARPDLTAYAVFWLRARDRGRAVMIALWGVGILQKSSGWYWSRCCLRQG